MALNNALLLTEVMHARQRPRRHVFRYGVYYLCFSLTEITQLSTRFLSLEKWNLFSFYRKDHASRDGASLEEWARSILAQFNITTADGDITLVTLPRVLGYVFNPVSFWFCHDRQGQVRAVISEVCNTFGERHSYISYHDDQHPILSHEWLRAEKLFHVSPFLPVKGYYLFRFTCNADKVHVIVNYHDDEGLMLATSLTGSRVPLTSKQLLTCFFRYPLVTFKIIALIHAEAVRLLFKGACYHSKPLPPTVEVSR